MSVDLIIKYSMKLHLLSLAFLITLANSQLFEHCQNGGFSVIRGRDNVNGAFIDRVKSHECFCHGTGFYGSLCDIPCPTYFNHSSYPVECINI